MRCSTGKSPSVKILRFSAVGVLLFFLAATPYAQTTETMSVSAIKNDIRYTEWQLKNLERNRTPAPRPAPIAWRQVREDFLQIQIESGELQKKVASGATSDARLLNDLINRITKRAGRLKRNLPLPAPAAGEASEDLKSNDDSFEADIKTLDRLVIRFTGNPIFKQSLVLDLNGGAQAARDLQSIIARGASLKKRFAGDEQKRR